MTSPLTDAISAGVNIHPLAAQKTDQGLAAIPRKLCGARLLGAEIAATMGTPAASAFCIISNEVRPLNSKMCWRSGKESFNKAQPNCSCAKIFGYFGTTTISSFGIAS